jgi:hypothetical protein
MNIPKLHTYFFITFGTGVVLKRGIIGQEAPGWYGLVWLSVAWGSLRNFLNSFYRDLSILG